MFRDMGNKIDVFFENVVLENEHKISNGVGVVWNGVWSGLRL